MCRCVYVHEGVYSSVLERVPTCVCGCVHKPLGPVAPAVAPRGYCPHFTAAEMQLRKDPGPVYRTYRTSHQRMVSAVGPVLPSAQCP